MINQKNFFDEVDKIGIENLPDALRKSVLHIWDKTKGKDWDRYTKDKAFQEVTKLTFKKLEEYIRFLSNKGLAGTKKAPAAMQERAHVKKLIVKETERISEEVAFVKRFLSMATGKSIPQKEVLGFINDLQKAIIEKRIRKTSKYAKEIMAVQEAAIKVYNAGRTFSKIILSPKTFARYQQIVQSEKLSLWVKFFKQYIDLRGINTNGQYLKEAKELIRQIQQAIHEGNLTETDKDFYALEALMIASMALSIKKKKRQPITIEKMPLNGIPEDRKIMCSTDFAKMQFNTIGFTGKWLDFIGDPSQGFTTMVYGRPKFGKSYLCVDFAGYLARNHGKVLYAAKEEKLDATLQKKLNEKEVAHPNLFVSDHLPEDLSAYDYIFLDSVTKFGLSPEDIEKLRAKNPGKSFIFIFQTTKDGNFRGENTYQHDVDVVIEVPERGKATQFGRFNQGGEIDIFDQPEANGSENLNGIKKKTSKKPPDWTEPEWLNVGDHWMLKQIKKFYEEGDFEMAMQIASNGDTVIREAIPSQIWKEMGGKLTPAGEAKIKEENSKKKRKNKS